MSLGFEINFKEPKATEATNSTLLKSQEGHTTLRESPERLLRQRVNKSNRCIESNSARESRGPYNTEWETKRDWLDREITEATEATEATKSTHRNVSWFCNQFQRAKSNRSNEINTAKESSGSHNTE